MGKDMTRVPDQNFWASTSEGVWFRPSLARLDPVDKTHRKVSPDHDGGAWCASSSDTGPWIAVDFGEIDEVTKIDILGQKDAELFVTSFELLYSKNCMSWETYKTEDGKKEVVFAGNDAHDHLHHIRLESPITARCVKLLIRTWNGKPCLRFDCIGCGAPVTTPTPITTPTRTTPCPGYLCRDNKTCIDIHRICNKYPDCPDGDDEPPTC